MNSVQATVLLAIITISGNVLEIMADVPEIKDLASVIEPHLNGTKLVNYTSRYLTKPGDNYGSLMLAITANVQKGSGEIAELPLIAKLPPITNKRLWKAFQPEITCRIEIAVYKYLSPAIRSLQLEAGIQENDIFDGFPKYYGSRISLNPNSTIVDRDAVLVQENIQSTGFKPGNRHIPFNMAEIKLILRELAKYHALPIAIRLKNPEEGPYRKIFNINTVLETAVKAQMEAELSQDNIATFMKCTKEEHDASFVGGPEKENLFRTIAHADLWTNNLMIKYDEYGQAIKVKFIDFQTAQYGSCAYDIIFLLFTSVEISILEYHMDELLQFYYEAFIKSLKAVHVSTDQYSCAGFLKEIQKLAKFAICRALRQITVILSDNSSLPNDFKDIYLEDVSHTNEKSSERKAKIRRIAQKYNIEINSCQ